MSDHLIIAPRKEFPSTVDLVVAVSSSSSTADHCCALQLENTSKSSLFLHHQHHLLPFIDDDENCDDVEQQEEEEEEAEELEEEVGGSAAGQSAVNSCCQRQRNLLLDDKIEKVGNGNGSFGGGFLPLPLLQNGDIVPQTSSTKLTQNHHRPQRQRQQRQRQNLHHSLSRFQLQLEQQYDDQDDDDHDDDDEDDLDHLHRRQEGQNTRRTSLGRQRQQRSRRRWCCSFSSCSSPYSIWKRRFIAEYQCSPDGVCKEVCLSALPHVAAFLFAIAFVLASCLIFVQLDDSLAQLPFHEVLLFAFSTVTTIGYGKIVPQSEAAKAFCVIYCVMGIPLVFVTITKLGHLFAEFYWILLASFRQSRRRRWKNQEGNDDEEEEEEEEFYAQDTHHLPLAVTACLLLLHSLVGGLMFHLLFDQMPIPEAIYFSFISITTIGYGDICPTPNGLAETLLIIGYLSAGISIMSTMFGTISDQLRRLHYIGRDQQQPADLLLTGSQEARIWFDGCQITVRELVSIVAQQFEVSPTRLREVLEELDTLIRLQGTITTTTTTTTTALLKAQQNDEEEKTNENEQNCDHQQQNNNAEAADKILLLNGDNLLPSGNDCRECSPPPPVLVNCLEEEEELKNSKEGSASASSINTEQEQMIQALGTLHRLGVKGTRTFRSPSLNSIALAQSIAASSAAPRSTINFCRENDGKRQQKTMARSLSVSPSWNLFFQQQQNVNRAEGSHRHASEQ